MPDFTKLAALHQLCREKQTCYSLHYNESCDLWSFEHDDMTTPTKDHSFDIMIDLAMEKVREL